jgi:acyl-CoA thioester hydrolase
VVEARCRYHFPARYDDEVVVKTRLEQASSRLVRFGYEMVRAADGRLLATGETKHVFCTRDMQPARLPAKYHPLFGI